MALDITAQDIIIDETTGLQQPSDIDPTGNTNLTLLHLLGLGTPLETAYQADFVVASGDPGETITSVVLTQDLSGTAFSTTDGVLTDIQTVDGNYVWLFQDSTNPDVVIGVIGTSDPTAEPDEGGDLAFSFGLDPTSNTNADLYLVQYVALLNPDTGDPDDRIDLTDHVFASITGTAQIGFSGANAAPGNHDFYLINSPDDASKQLLVIGLNGGTANVSTQGFGINNQSINPGETLQVDFVTGGDLNAGSASQIQYDSHIETITEAGFTINQITPSQPAKRVDITITAYNNTANQQGSDFFDGTTTNPVDITSIKLAGTSGYVGTITLNGDYVTGSGTIHVSGLEGTGNAVTITGLDNVTTVDITTATPMDRMTVAGVDANEGCDITEFHFKATTTNAHTEEVGSFINFDDDGPTAGLTEEDAKVLHDETAGVDASSDDQPLASLPGAFSGLGTAIGWAASASAVVTPNSSLGADGGTETLSLDVSAANADSGFDSLDGHNILLNLEGGLVVGRVDANDDNSVDSNDAVAIAVSIDDNGILSIAQYIAIAHGDTGDPDDVQTMNDGVLLAVVTADDGDGDSDETSIAIGDKVQIRDDGPSITADGTVPTLTTDDSDLSDTTSTSFASVFTTDPGTDGDAITYELGVKSGATVDSGLDDTLSGDNILLRLVNGQVEGYLENDTSTVAFVISVDANTGEVTLTQDRAIIHDDPLDPVESGTSAATLAAADLVTLKATITDGDGDTADATANIGTAFTFEDDGPTITVPFDGDASGGGSDGTHETLANTTGAEASGAFGYDVGADARLATFYDATHSDFVDQDTVTPGIQISLGGNLTGLVPAPGTTSFISSSATLQSESATEATFNWQISYDSDPNTAGNQPGTAAGTLVFDKDNDSYTITLTNTLEGFSFDVLHTAELVSKQPTSNTGHPKIVLETLLADDPNTQAHDGFFVQFTGNLVNKTNPFGLTDNGQGKSNPFDSTFTPDLHQMVSNANETWVSATQSTNGVAGDTIQKGELLTLRFFSSDVGIATEAIAPTAGAGDMAIKFDGIGNSEDLMLILNLVNDGADNIVGTADDTSITRAIYAENADIFKTGQVPAPYSSEFTLDNNDGLLIIERNDYNAAGEDYVLQGVQIMQSGNGITGQDPLHAAIALNGATGAGGGSNATGGLVSFDAVDNDVLKITDIGFTTTQTSTPDAHLDFGVQVADADGDMTTVQHIFVDIA
ncbi:MAG: hypothetical protein E5V92_18495 [Mesorhizobium sp.]|uniref:DUF5801 repeats-in-toxin domain-containing protein n=1 Tax=unclassified Mesorhizobium TaxID=325217 RepID=UPI000F753709|nr:MULTISPECIES: DUF5801 repeats-in-toxin domain-containing protein [unclassified Mesorhizobium]AZO75422.1 hypothetical protein EJ067_32780 [Mesorhizobium sp. M1D.F.Ca.ET.043.01.1.1]RWA94206.1 MAG: hypothetical protein EOQ32_12805 [Mesorhizobium sp.]TJW83441.1 MAG: hypothetical protein E5V92_18495 [Mesorhizobium sp.]